MDSISSRMEGVLIEINENQGLSMFKKLLNLFGGAEELPIDPLEVEKQAEEGNANAQYAMGKQYYQEYGNPANDYKKAFHWFSKAAEQDHVEAQHYLGQMYDTGRGVDKDSSKAFILFSKAAHQGHAASQFDIAIMYKNGEGVRRDLEKAKFWFEKAAKQGHKQAQKWKDHHLLQ